MKKVNLRNPLLLTIAAAIWGFAFAAQSEAMDYIGPFTLNCIRNVIGALVLVPVIFVTDRYEKSRENGCKKEERAEDKRLLLTGGICCGLLLTVATNLQQLGIKYTTVGKAGFITAIYIVLVPVAGLFFKKKCGLTVWISVGLALTGFYFLTMIGESSFTKGDIFVLLCAIVFTGHILCVDYFSPKVSGVAYTFQILGQKNYNPAVAALIMSLESVFSVLGGWLFLHETLSASEGLGCILIFAGIILSQIPKEWYGRH